MKNDREQIFNELMTGTFPKLKITQVHLIKNGHQALIQIKKEALRAEIYENGPVVNFCNNADSFCQQEFSHTKSTCYSSVQSLSCVRLFVTP